MKQTQRESTVFFKIRIETPAACYGKSPAAGTDHVFVTRLPAGMPLERIADGDQGKTSKKQYRDGVVAYTIRHDEQ